jgi:hypothetical protein
VTKSRTPTREEIEALTAYLPLISADGFSPVETWRGGQAGEDGALTFPYPVYNPVAGEFFNLAGADCWSDYEYVPRAAGEMLRDAARVKTASLVEIKSMLTYCVRGERFSDGHWGAMLSEGYLRRLLERLEEIKAEMPE